jgi:CubicO group peptidase (beta-lactamase class C family)
MNKNVQALIQQQLDDMRSHLWRMLPALMLIASHIPNQAFAQSRDAEACIREIMDSTPVSGMSVAVVKKNRIVYSQSFGLKNIEKNTPLTDDCLFRIASISKSFSATAVMKLVESGKISLDDDVGNLIGFRVRNPGFPDKVITVRMLLSHRSSINDSQGYFTLDAIDPDRNPDREKCFNQYEPGSAYMYCNLNYNMLGAIIERISGERFDLHIRRHILDPLGIEGGYCVDSLDRSRFATIYEYRTDSTRFVASPAAYAPRSEEIARYVMGRSTPVFSPTGGMKISARGLAQYMMMHMNKGKQHGKRIMSRKSADKMQSVISEKEGYGMAILTTTKLIPGKTLKGHTGSAYGLYSAMFFHPKEKFGIVVISNGCHPGTSDGYNSVIRKTINCLYEKIVR